MCANWRGSKLTLTAQTLIWCLSMGKQHMAQSHITTHFIFSLDFFCCHIFLIQQHHTTQNNAIWWSGWSAVKLLWWKVGFTPRTIGPQFAAFKLKCNLNIRSTATSGLYYQKLQSGANVLNSHFKTPFFLDQSAPSGKILEVWGEMLLHWLDSSRGLHPSTCASDFWTCPQTPLFTQFA